MKNSLFRSVCYFQLARVYIDESMLAVAVSATTVIGEVARDKHLRAIEFLQFSISNS